MELSEASIIDESVGPDLESARTECVCPKCRTYHHVKIFWTGRGMPRKFCSTCKKSSSTIDLISAVPAALLQTL